MWDLVLTVSHLQDSGQVKLSIILCKMKELDYISASNFSHEELIV